MDFPSALAILASPGGHAVPRAEAESIVQAVVNDPSRGIQALCHALECDGTRRLAAVLLSTAAARHWSVLGDDAKAAMRQRTLAALSRAEDRAEMRALVHAADILASRSADDGSPWHELLPALDDAAKSARATHREAAVLLLGSIVESTGAHMNDHHAALVALFAAHLDDPGWEVQQVATRALGTTALALQRRGDFLVVADLLPRILAACVDAAARRLDRSDDEGVAVAMEAIAAAASVDSDATFGPDASLLPRVVDVQRRRAPEPAVDAHHFPGGDVANKRHERLARVRRAPARDSRELVPRAETQDRDRRHVVRAHQGARVAHELGDPAHGAVAARRHEPQIVATAVLGDERHELRHQRVPTTQKLVEVDHAALRLVGSGDVEGRQRA